MNRSQIDPGELVMNHVSIITNEREPVKVNYLISDQGGQGDVYHASLNGQEYALKWYNKSSDDVIGGAQYDTITKICGKCPGEEFIWPHILVTEEEPRKGKKFGYLMPLIPNGCYEMNDYLRKDGDLRAVRFSSFHAMLTAGMNIASAMQKLHLKGFSYKDLNPNNFCIRPDNGDVLVVDNDNVSADVDVSTVKGMKGYMAPEIPRSHYVKNPDTLTDYYSLAVILYRLFFIDHPMDGKMWEKAHVCTDQVEEYFYAFHPVFHYHPEDDSNRPQGQYAPNVAARWRKFPLELRRQFVNAFTKGIDHPEERNTEGTWIAAIANCRDCLIRMNVGTEQFVNFDDARTIPPRCLKMQIGNHRMALYPSKAIYGISVNGNTQQYREILAGITYSKSLDTLMIRNLTDHSLRVWSPATRLLTEIQNGEEHPVFPGVLVEFQKKPRIVGEVCVP